MPQRPRCPICGHTLFVEYDNEEWYTTSYLICSNEDCELTDIITQEEYAELKKQVEDYECKTSEVYHDNGEHKLEARWKRKNREAQYKRTIARKEKEKHNIRESLNAFIAKEEALIDKLKMKIKEAKAERARLKQELAKTKQDLYDNEVCIDLYELNAESAKRDAEKWEKEATAMYKRFGQDIEGS